uniref:Uncharacterized protein n=1 Tax=Pseudomonas phage PACT201 TaxID=3230130 RepID=A0AAU8GSM6_9VIRU
MLAPSTQASAAKNEDGNNPSYGFGGAMTDYCSGTTHTQCFTASERSAAPSSRAGFTRKTSSSTTAARPRLGGVSCFWRSKMSVDDREAPSAFAWKQGGQFQAEAAAHRPERRRIAVHCSDRVSPELGSDCVDHSQWTQCRYKLDRLLRSRQEDRQR